MSRVGNREQGTGNGEQGTGNRERGTGNREQMVSDYRELKVWQMSKTLCRRVYELLRKFPDEERYALCDQLRRAVVSVPSNIAEGNGRASTSEYVRFLSIARGSLFEVRTQLELAEEFGYIKVPEDVQSMMEQIAKMLYALMCKLKG